MSLTKIVIEGELEEECPYCDSEDIIYFEEDDIYHCQECGATWYAEEHEE